MTAPIPALPAREGPLDGVLIVDLSRVLAGPFATQILSDLGAQILKVERPGSGDDSRTYGPFANGHSAYFATVNRGKGSIALALDRKADLDLLMRILPHADVLVENFRPGTLEKFGLGHDQLKEKFPQLIYASVSGFGQTGPLSRRPAYDMVVQAMGGIVSITGEPDGEPVRVGASVGDLTAGIYAALGIVAALYDRAVRGTGRRLDVSLLDCQVPLVEHAIMRHVVTGEIPGPLGSRHATIAPFQAYATADGHMVVAAGNDQLFGVLAQALGRPELKSDPRFKTNGLRVEHVDELKAEMEKLLTQKPTAHWLGVLTEGGVPCAPINTIDKLMAEPQIQARNMIVETEDPVVGPLKLAGNPLKLSGFDDPPTRVPARELDADRQAILDWLAGL
jgi:CoA:oxalate CoA-transferase